MKDLKKQAEDIDLMIERMDEQVKSQTREYRNELNQIEVLQSQIGPILFYYDNSRLNKYKHE